ncbi:hypothetical protein Mp_4g06240 [Marchantia polymorpha subsp. ruderalis]|nr:hypothetical protein MARPO_0114s0029 [Marchantia polymorpha]BBN07762.1 hypothetical protein Mp_4g06240 [Marchantia polymorpha subsp. ruderalis]|eukprot:PTQ31210.1 hypothetical protein MARPO_0114s0029 [Marchantia polymorpha]
MVNLLKDNLPVTTSAQAPAIESLIKKLKKATECVQSCSQQGFFRARWNPNKTTEEIAALRQDLGDAFLLSLVHTTLDHVSSAGKKQDIFQSRMKEIAASATGKGGKHKRSDTSDEDDEFHDPITYELMCDPVKGSDGHTYDRWTIIDNDMTQSPFDQRKDKVFVIACDDINVRGRLFERYQSSGVQERFHARRESYREQALMLACAGSQELDVEVLKMLDHVLKWADDDLECRELRESIAERMRNQHRRSRRDSISISFTPFGSGRRESVSSASEVRHIRSRHDAGDDLHLHLPARDAPIPTRDESRDQTQDESAQPGCLFALVILVGVGLCYLLSSARRKHDDEAQRRSD